jgi:hypothetical protein
MRLAGLFSRSVPPPLDLIRSDVLTFGLLFQILSADFEVCLPLVMLVSDGQIVLTRSSTGATQDASARSVVAKLMPEELRLKPIIILQMWFGLAFPRTLLQREL